MKNCKKIISLLITLVMIIGALSLGTFFAFAEGATTNVAKVGNTEYATIDEAIANWGNNQTLTLLADVTLTDVVTLKSTEHHILNLGTYTMTAASGKNAFVIQACGTGSAERSAITINADANNPGGINAGSKCVVYYKYADGGISTEDRPIIKINGGVFTGATSSWGTAGIYTIGTAARKCATLNISGGTFNCSINGSGKSKLIISGGTFNYSVGSQGDSTALRLISGGTFKTFGFMTADSNNTKFWFGTSMANSNVGVHVDDNGYIVVGGPVVTEAGETFAASSANYSGANSLLQYSSAKTNGLYYTSVEQAFADNNSSTGSVTVYVDELDMTGISYKGTIVVPAESTLKITNAPETLVVKDAKGNALTPSADGSYTTVEPAVKVDGAGVVVTELGNNSYDIALGSGASLPETGVTMTFLATGDANGMAYVVHEHEGKNYIYVGKVKDGKISFTNTVGFSTFTVYEGGLQEALNAAAAGTGNVTVEILEDIDLTGVTWNPVRVSEPGYPLVTVNGNNKTITGLSDMLFSGTWAGKSGLIINDLTIANSTIVHDENDAAGNIGVGAFIGFPQASATITLNNCHLVDSTVKGGHWTGGLIGYAAGYAGTDGPVFMNLTIKDCSVTGSTITGKGSVGGIIGHATGNAWTNVAIETTTVSGNTVTSTGSSTNKAGAVVGTIGAAGQATTVNGVEKTGGVAVSATVSDNTVTSNGTSITTVYGRQGSATGMLEIAGGSYDSNPIEENVSYAAPAEGYMIVENTDGSFGLAVDPAYGKVAKIGDNYYATLAEAAAAAKAGDEIVLLADVAEDVTIPAGVIFNGNGKQVGAITAAGEITFKGHTKATNFSVQYTNTTINIGEGACLEITGTGRLVIGHGCTFNITGTITDAKNADKATIQPSLIMPGASFTGAGVTFNVTNAYIKAPSSYCSSSKSASGTFDFNITNSIVETAGKLAFEAQSTAATVNFELKNSVLTTGSHLVFGVSRGEIVIDNSNVNVGVSRQLENQSTMIVKNGSVVNGAVATSSNAKNPGTVIVDNATYAVTGEFSGSDLGTGTLIVKNGATVSAGSITNANIQIDATGMQAGNEINLTANLSKLAGTIEVVNNDKLEAKLVNGKIVLAVKPVAEVNGVKYATVAEAIAAAKNGDTVILYAGEFAPINISNKNITIQGTVGANGELLTTIKGGNPAITGHGFNGTIKDLKIVDAFKVMYAEPAGNVTVDNVYVTGATYGFHLIAYSEGLSWTIQNSYMDLSWANSFGVYGSGDAAIVIKGNVFESTSPYYPDYGALHVNTFLPNVTVEGNIFGENAKIMIRDSVTDTSEINISKNYHADGANNAFVEDSGVKTPILEYYADKDMEQLVKCCAQIGTNAYASLAEAVAAAQNGDTITLLADVVLDDTLTIAAGKTIVLNLNGKTISQEKACTASYSMIENMGNLTITGNGKISFTDTSAGDPTFGWGSYTIRNAGTLVVENGIIEHKGAQAFATHMICAIFQYSGSTTINGGTISTPNYRSVRLWKGDMTINGGTFDGQVWVQAVDNTAELTINGGTFGPNGGDGSSVFVTNSTYDVKLAVTGGTFSTKVGCSNATKLAGAITGGSFTQAAANGTNVNLLKAGFIFGEVVDNYCTLEKGLRGEGTKEDPYIINTVNDLILFRDSVNAGETKYNAPGVYVVLTADIDLASVANWTPIGNWDYSFDANFNGQGHKIMNLKMSDSTAASGEAYLGFFGITANNTIENFVIENVTISSNGQIVAAAIAYPYYTTVKDITVCGDIAIKGGNYTAGVLAYTRLCVNASNLTVSGNAGSYITGAQVVGGVIADIQMNKGLVADYSNFSVSGVKITGTKMVGGISGIIATQTLNGATVKNVTIVSGDSRVGIVAGCFGGTSTITDIVYENVNGATAIIGSTYDNGVAVQAKIGDTYYATLANAIEAANEGDVIALLAPVVIKNDFTLDKNVTISATHGSEYAMIHVENGATLTINNGKITYAAGGNNTGAAIWVEGALVQNGGTIEVTGRWNLGFAVDLRPNAWGTAHTVPASFIMNGGKVVSSDTAVRVASNSSDSYTELGVSFTMNGGSIESEWDAIFVQHLYNGDLDVKVVGGTVSGANSAMRIYGGAGSDIDMIVTDGQFTGAIKVADAYANTDAIALSGGTYSVDVSNYCADGFKVKANNNGTYGVVKYYLAGEGTEADPYIINNVDDLIFFRDSVNAGETKYNAPGVYVVLTANIDLASVANWTPIGNWDATFDGNFNGQGYKIMNLKMSDNTAATGEAYLGFFGITANNTIENFVIENVTISSNGQIVAAAIAYPYYTTVKDITVCGNIAIKGGNYTAGVLAYTRLCVNASNLTVSGNAGSYITGAQVVGGIIADIQMNKGLVANYSNFSVSGVKITGTKMVGGISGIIATQTLNGATVKNVTIVSGDSRVGIVAGCFGGTSTITNVVYENVNGATAIIGSTYDNGVAVQAKIGDTYYATFNAAFAAANAGDTITLLCDVTLSDILVIDKAITLDGNGHKLTSTAGRAINISGADGVTIKNLTINAKGERAINIIQNATNVTIENVTATAYNYTVNVASSAPNAVVAIKNSTLNGLCTVNVSGAGADVTVTGSTINCNDNSTTAGESYAALCLNKAAVGGSIIATNTTVNVTAGSDSEKGRNGAENGTVTINGSTADVSVTVAVITYPGSDYYYGFASIAKAIEFANAGDTITLIRDVTLSDILVINKAITLDGNGKTLTSTAGRAINISGADGVTIKNLTINAKGERAINIIQNATNVTIENVTATAYNYTVNVASSAPNAVVAIKNSTLNGLCTVNVSGAGADVTVTGSTINCNDNNTTVGESYAALSLNRDAINGKIIATGCTINVTAGSDSVKARNGAENGLITIDGTTDGVNVVVAIITYEGSNNYHAFYTLASAIEFAKAGDTITLIRDVASSETITINKAITLDGNGKKLTSTAARAINVSGADGVTIKNLTVTTTGERAINVIQGATNLTLDNVTATAANYAVNLAGSAANAKVTIKNSDLTGLAVVNIAAANANVAITNTMITNKDASSAENYGAITIGSDAAGAKVTVSGGEIITSDDSCKAMVFPGNADVTGTDDVHYIVATIGAAGFESLQAAIDYAKAGQTITLIRDVTTSATISINKNITINANNKTITYTGTDRAIQITGGTVVINDLTVTMTNAPEGSRGINLYNGGTNAAIDVTLNNVTVNGGKAYAVNIGGGKDNKLTINGSTLTGYAAINVHTSSVNHTIVVDGSVLNGKNHNNNYHFGTVVVDGTNAHTLKITNTTVTTENLAGVTNKYYQVIVGANCAYEVCDGISVAVRNVYNKNDGLYYIGLQSAINAAKAGDTIVLLADIETSETFTVPAGKKITLDLNGKTISGIDTTNKSFSLITNKGELTITGNGKITLKATQDNGYNRSSSVISNTVGGKLIVESGTIEHLGGHTMAYAIDNLTNGKGTYAETIINGGTIKSTYVGIRQFLNGVDADNILTVNGGTVTGNNTSIFFQDPSKNCNSGKLTVGDGAVLGNRVYISGTEGTAWNVEVAISAQALGTNGIVIDEIPETSVIKEVNGVYGFVQSVASVDGIGYATLAEAYAAAQDGDEVKILVAGTYKVPTGKNITITGAVDGVVFDNIGAHGMGGASVTFNNVTFNYAANSTYSGLQHAGNLVYNNCIFNGQVFLYGASETFNNCTFNNTGDNYNVWTYGAKAVEFNGCTFNSDGKAVLIYTEGADTFNTVTVTDSTFKASAAVDGKAAIEMDSSLSAGIKLTVTNSTATGFGTGNVSGNSLWNNKKGNNTDANNDITVVVDDTQVLAPVTFVAKIGNIGYTTIDAAIAAAQAGDTVTLLADTTLNETITIDKKITIDLNGNTVTGADGAIVFNVKAETTIENGTIKGNKSGTSSGLIDIYANLTMDGVTVETSKINALRFKAGDCTATLTNCNVIGAFKGYGGSVWNIVSGTYKAASTAINDQLNGTASISGGTFYYEIAAEECAPGYAVVNNGDGTYGVKYAPVAFVDANNNGILDDGEAVYGSLEAIFNTYKTGNVYIVFTDNAVIATQVDTDADAKYYLNTKMAEGVTVEFAYADNWNYIQKMYVGENVTIKAPYINVWTEFEVYGTIITDYLYINGGKVLVAEGAEVTATTGDATIQVKNGATLTVNGTVNTAILNVWAGDSKLVVNGANAKVNASWIDIWDGTPVVNVENGATLAVDSIKVSRGGEIKVDNATLDADKVELGHNGTSAGNLTVNNGTVTGEIKLTVVGSTFTGPEGMNVTTDVDGYVVVYENGTYSLAVAVASINGKNYASLQAAINAAQNGDVIALLWKEGDAPIAMNGAVYGKTVTITGTATVDWSKGFLFVGRGGAGNGTVIFDNANLTSASDSKSFGIHVSGREKNTNNKYDGTLVIKNSTIELDYLINKGSITLVNSTLTVKNGFSIGGRPASETESGADATATITLTNNSIVVVDNHNGMGLGYEAIGVMNIDATSAFECTQNFLVTAKGTMNIAGTVKIAGKLTNNGKINLTAVAATLQSNECGNVSTNLADYIVAYADGAYKLVERNYVAQVGDKKYESFAEALAAVNAGDTIKLLADVEVSGTLILNQGITLDLNGKTLTTYFLVAFKGNHVIDSTRGKGLLKIAEDNAMLSADNANMAVYTGEGYKFASVKTTNYKVENVTDTGFTVKFRPGLGSDVQEYLNTTDEATASGMQIIVRLSWISDGIAQYQDSVYNAEMMATMYNSTNTSQTGSLSLTVKNVGNYENLEATLILKSDAGIQISQHMYTFNETTSAE